MTKSEVKLSKKAESSVEFIIVIALACIFLYTFLTLIHWPSFWTLVEIIVSYSFGVELVKVGLKNIGKAFKDE